MGCPAVSSALHAAGIGYLRWGKTRYAPILQQLGRTVSRYYSNTTLLLINLIGHSADWISNHYLGEKPTSVMTT